VKRVPFISCALILAVVSCGQSEPVDKQAAKAAAHLPDVNAPAPSATGEPRKDTEPAKPLPPPAAKIPAALQGRWGLTPADCSGDPAAAKGLLVVAPGDLRFYESKAVPTADAAADADSISGTFAFTGEGQSWTRYEALKLNRHVLTRTEIKPTASFSYARCS
jgi:hypothetical protein